MAATIQMFLTQATIPYRYMTEEELFSKSELSRKHAAEGSYRAADSMVAEMREKYGL